MKKLLLLSCFFVSAHIFAQTAGYSIGITMRPYKNQYVYLGYYYGKIKALADSAMLNANSTGLFKGKEKLNGGIYFIVSPRKANWRPPKPKPIATGLQNNCVA
jgi:hypothetical protein